MSGEPGQFQQEAVFEKQEIKNDLFREVSKYFGEDTIKKNLGKKIDIDEIINRIHPVETYEELAQCGLVIEAD